MAMFRSFVSAAQLRQPHPQPQLQHGESLESQFSCPICLEVYHKPVSIASCAHTMRRKQNKASMVSRALDVCYETSVAVDVPASKRLDESSKESETTVVSNEREQEKEAVSSMRRMEVRTPCSSRNYSMNTAKRSDTLAAPGPPMKLHHEICCKDMD
ncbi:E3 ubiquitin-protein ligase RNF166 [Tachysurus ichikawai]